MRAILFVVVSIVDVLDSIAVRCDPVSLVSEVPEVAENSLEKVG